jgi:hypothetical protein
LQQDHLLQVLEAMCSFLPEMEVKQEEVLLWEAVLVGMVLLRYSLAPATQELEEGLQLWVLLEVLEVHR